MVDQWFVKSNVNLCSLEHRQWTGISSKECSCFVWLIVYNEIYGPHFASLVTRIYNCKRLKAITWLLLNFHCSIATISTYAAVIASIETIFMSLCQWIQKNLNIKFIECTWIEYSSVIHPLTHTPVQSSAQSPALTVSIDYHRHVTFSNVKHFINFK